MKKSIAFLLGLVTVVGMSTPVLAADIPTSEPVVISTNVSDNQINNNLIIAGKVVNIGNFRVVISNGNVMVPLEITAESLGFKVSPDADNKIITLDNDKINTQVEVGKDNYYYQSSHAIGLTAPESFGTAPMLVDNVVYVPIKIYQLLFNDKNVIGNFYCDAKDGELVHVNNETYSVGYFVQSISTDVINPIGMPNPIKEYNTVQEAQKSLKFKNEELNYKGKLIEKIDFLFLY